MSAFDQFSHLNPFPAGPALSAHLNRNAAEGELFDAMPTLEFVARFRRYWDRGLKYTAIVLSVRHAIETANRDLGAGNRARRRLLALRAGKTEGGK